jgi:hypothetical protein
VFRDDAVLLVASYTTHLKVQHLLNVNSYRVCRHILSFTVGLTARPAATVSSVKVFDSNQRIGNVGPMNGYEQMLRVHIVHISSRHNARCLRPIIGYNG